MKDGGVVVWVVGDATIKGSETGTSSAGASCDGVWLRLHDTMIYQKVNPVPDDALAFANCCFGVHVCTEAEESSKTFNPPVVSLRDVWLWQAIEA